MQFAQFMKERVRNGEIPYRKSYIRSVMDRIIVEGERIMIKGRTDVLQNRIAQPATDGTQVPTAIPNWCSATHSLHSARSKRAGNAGFRRGVRHIDRFPRHNRLKFKFQKICWAMEIPFPIHHIDHRLCIWAKIALARSIARRSRRVHYSLVIALLANILWCSDYLEQHARNREVVRVLFVLDACDRETIAWLAVANAGTSGEMVRDLMVASVERRFGGTKTPYPVDWLSDNGNGYIAAETADTATALGLKQLFTPVRSPESNGTAGSFRETLKRDYSRVTILPDAETIKALLPGWIGDHCQIAPHSGLKFRSPRKFIRFSA
ncbi:DDE-type integrase/transposase/recombinase [Jiella mangrovi]|uniref:DDE-type integrase/transposase/recombinase n=1 Tax=Jiella mangrovi TaxID=2821407 RepID=A0ABS4BG84_9HYPH|nr:DDE-type integrase/transposase/recombinase [Jiella mangrovi]